MDPLPSRRAVIAGLIAAPLLAGCARDRGLYRASHDPAGTPVDWDRGRGCDRPQGLRRGRRDRHGRTRERGPHRECGDYRSAAEGYPDTRGGSAPPPLPPPPPVPRTPH